MPTVKVLIPEDAQTGSTIEAPLPDGRVILLHLPQGAIPGQLLEVQYDESASTVLEPSSVAVVEPVATAQVVSERDAIPLIQAQPPRANHPVGAPPGGRYALVKYFGVSSCCCALITFGLPCCCPCDGVHVYIAPNGQYYTPQGQPRDRPFMAREGGSNIC
mmetsp:Transcript_23/g.96  ORF Transcript_23/g.96 Transcript_23/m.96 type:complete len:161 (-) Transcript_23:364-846(-)